jgi:hypothetical protein
MKGLYIQKLAGDLNLRTRSEFCPPHYRFVRLEMSYFHMIAD